VKNTVRALIIPTADLSQYTFTLQVKDDNGNWVEIDKVYRHPTEDKLYNSIEELKEDLTNGESQAKSND
jgi:hypothetical protein